MKVALLGGTRGMGRALGRAMAARGDRLFLLGRNADDVARSARDLEAHGAAGEVGTAYCDLLDPPSCKPALARADAALSGIETIVLTAGAFDTQDTLEREPDRLSRVLTASFTSSVLFCEEARRVLLARGGGTLCAFSSVAGDRPRKPVVLYGAAKAGLTYYLEGLDLRYRRAGLRVVCVKPGFVRTSMTEGLPVPPFAGDPDSVARVVLRAIDAGKPVVYAPPVWRWVMLVIRYLPRFVMRRVGF